MSDWARAGLGRLHEFLGGGQPPPQTKACLSPWWLSLSLNRGGRSRPTYKAVSFVRKEPLGESEFIGFCSVPLLGLEVGAPSFREWLEPVFVPPVSLPSCHTIMLTFNKPIHT